jgi:hypothetical protein
MLKSMAVSALRVPFAPGKSPFRGKGVTYRNYFDYAEEFIPGGRERVLAAFSDPALRAFASQPFLAGSFYDTLPMVALCETAAALMNKPFVQFVREFSAVAAERDTTGVYRMLLKLVSPNLVMERAPAVAKQYFNFVTATVEKVAPKSYRSTAHGIPEVVAQFYMLSTEAFLARALMLAGAVQPLHKWLPLLPEGTKEGMSIVALRREVSWK